VTIADSVGNIVMTYTYDPFGNVTAKTGTLQNSYLYAGYQFDDETGLYYLNARYYDPAVARFMSEDSYTGDSNDPLSLNLYTYCHNEPMMYSDPTGHAAIPVDPRFCAAMAMQQQQYYYAYAAIMESQRAGLLSQEQTGTLAAKAVTEAVANGYDPTTVKQLTVNDKDGHILDNFTSAIAAAKNPGYIPGKDTSDISSVDEIAQLTRKGANGDYYKIYEDNFKNNLYSGQPVAMYGVYPDDEYYKAVTSGLIDPAKITLAEFINIMGPMWEYKVNHKTWKDDVRDGLITLGVIGAMIAGRAIIQCGLRWLADALISNGITAEQAAAYAADIGYIEDECWQYADAFTNNPFSNTVVLGKFTDNALSYERVGAVNKWTYFFTDNKIFDAMKDKIGYDGMWVINRAFIVSQEIQGKAFILTTDPAKADWSYLLEIETLQALGYKFVQSGAFWKAVR